jgi:hypothetical protein
MVDPNAHWIAMYQPRCLSKALCGMQSPPLMSFALNSTKLSVHDLERVSTSLQKRAPFPAIPWGKVTQINHLDKPESWSSECRQSTVVARLHVLRHSPNHELPSNFTTRFTIGANIRKAHMEGSLRGPIPSLCLAAGDLFASSGPIRKRG